MVIQAPSMNLLLPTTSRVVAVAAALRALKKWVLTPKEDTPIHFVRTIFQAFVYATNGEWDSLLGWARVIPEKPQPSADRQPIKSWIRRFFVALGQIILALAPIGILWLLESRNILVDDTIISYGKSVAVAWAISVLLHWIKPELVDKVNPIDIMSDIKTFRKSNP